MRRRDSQRKKVYLAEREAFDFLGLASCTPLEKPEIEKIVKAVVRTKKRKFGYLYQVTVAYPKNRNRATCWFRGPREIRISLPPWSRNKLFLCHELAHFLSGPQIGHHGKFVSNYIQLVRRFMGPETAKLLKTSFKKFRVKTKGGIE